MCANSKCCQKPKELKHKPKDCSTEQIEKCHGGQKPHPCLNPSQDKGTE